MMINKCVSLVLGLVISLAAGFGYAADTNPVPQSSQVRNRPRDMKDIGDPAPALTVQEWIKGKPVKIQPGTNIYVLVFCTLSRANEMAITNLNALQKEYQDKGVVVVAVSGESPLELRNFITSKGGGIEFSVAADDLAQKTTSEYGRLFRQMMLPRAYIVGTNGEVLWHGHPLRDNLGLVVSEITTGRFDLEQTRKAVAASEQMEQYLALARQDDPRTGKIGKIMLQLRNNDAPGLCELASKIATDPYIANRDLNIAGQALDRAEQLATTNAASIAATRAILQVEKYLSAVRQQDAVAAKLGRSLLASRTNDAVGLCDLAFRIATDFAVEGTNRDAGLATAALDRAAQLTTTNAVDIAVDRAILLFQTGKQEAGLAQAKKALEMAQNAAEKSEAETCVRAMENRLAAIKNNQTNSGPGNASPAKP